MEKKEIIRCPGCGSIQIGKIKNTFPHPTYLHECGKCKYDIMESEWEALQAYSIQQPWAYFIINGYKNVENRGRNSKKRGYFLIHSPMKFDTDGYTFIMSNLDYLGLKGISIPKPNEFRRGGVVGVSYLDHVVTQSDSPWFYGPYGYVLKNSKAIDFIPCKGNQIFFYPKIS